MTVDRNMAQTVVHPAICLKYTYSDQVRHDVGEPVIVVPFYPNDFNSALRIREFADETQELPVFFFQTGKIEVGKDVAEQDESLKPALLEDQHRLAGVTRLRPQVQVRED